MVNAQLFTLSLSLCLYKDIIVITTNTTDLTVNIDASSVSSQFILWQPTKNGEFLHHSTRDSVKLIPNALLICKAFTLR